MTNGSLRMCQESCRHWSVSQLWLARLLFQPLLASLAYLTLAKALFVLRKGIN